VFFLWSNRKQSAQSIADAKVQTVFIVQVLGAKALSYRSGVIFPLCCEMVL